MSYKACVDIVISFSILQTYSFRKQGSIQFRLCLFRETQLNRKLQKDEKRPIIYCHPYCIARKAEIADKSKHCTQQKDSSQLNQPTNSINGLSSLAALQSQFVMQNDNIVNQSMIDEEQEYYYSKTYETKYNDDQRSIEQSVFFRTHIETQELQNTHLFIKVELLFSPDSHNLFKPIGFFEAKIRKMYDVGTYLPITFDQFGGFAIHSIYNSTIMEFKFQQQFNQTEFCSFEEYLSAVSNRYKRSETRVFYEFYRKFLEKQLHQIQRKQRQLMKELNIKMAFNSIAMLPNTQLQRLISNLPANFGNYNSSYYRPPNVNNLPYLESPQSHRRQYSSLENMVIDGIEMDFLDIKAHIYVKWNQYVIFITEQVKAVTTYHRKIYDANVKERFKNHVFSQRIQSQFDWTHSKYMDSGKDQIKLAERDKRKMKQEELWKQCFPIQNKDFFEDEKKTIKIFEQIYEVDKQTKTNRSSRKGSLQSDLEMFRQKDSRKSGRSIMKQELINMNGDGQENYNNYPSIIQDFNIQYHYHQVQGPRTNGRKCPLVKQISLIPRTESVSKQKGKHLIVLVHGYQASRQDFIFLKSCLQIRFGAKVFISSSNEGRTEQNIESMGKRLAIQLNNYFKGIAFSPETRISFIGHSMGGIIIRSALTFLTSINQYLNTYMSFSSPHLGYLYESSTIVQAGLWFLNTWQKSQSIEELCMRDSSDLRNCYLYQLAERKCLDNFKNIALISSSQDQYVPYESARVQKNTKLLQGFFNSPNYNVIPEMVDNLLGEVSCQEISRLNVVFNIQANNFDSFIGRTAHIKYLSDQKFIKMFCLSFERFFI